MVSNMTRCTDECLLYSVDLRSNGPKNQCDRVKCHALVVWLSPRGFNSDKNTCPIKRSSMQTTRALLPAFSANKDDR